MKDIRILIADAHKLMRDCLASALTAADKAFIIVGEVESGLKLIDMAQELCPDVIIMDTAIPDMNGVDAASQILSQNPKIKILAVSTIWDREYVMGMLNSGVSGYMLKSCPLVEVTKALELIAQDQIYLCPCVTQVVVQTALSARKGKEGECFSLLSKREREVLQLISEGHTCKQIADKLFISQKTVQIHRANLKKKLNLDSTAALTRFAVSRGLTSLDFISPPKDHY